jgi:isoaspartyl peptidase/L-asparaginase-like protein (Ntn-hydrolase superfamily)
MEVNRRCGAELCVYCCCKYTIKKLKKYDASVGFSAVNRKGNYIMMFNTKGMYRGVVTNEKNAEVKIY